VDAPELPRVVHAVSAAAAAAGRAGPVQLRAARHEEARLVRSEVLVDTLDKTRRPQYTQQQQHAPVNHDQSINQLTRVSRLTAVTM